MLRYSIPNNHHDATTDTHSTKPGQPSHTLQIKSPNWAIHIDTKTLYFMSHSLGRIACPSFCLDGQGSIPVCGCGSDQSVIGRFPDDFNPTSFRAQYVANCPGGNFVAMLPLPCCQWTRTGLDWGWCLIRCATMDCEG
jgi:hypothetical protein